MLFEYILFLKGQKEDDMTKSDQKILLAARIVKFYNGDNDSIWYSNGLPMVATITSLNFNNVPNLGMPSRGFE